VYCSGGRWPFRNRIWSGTVKNIHNSCHFK
jgi:hypothetical protein